MDDISSPACHAPDQVRAPIAAPYSGRRGHDTAAMVLDCREAPHGYPKLGLVAKTLPLRYRPGADLGLLRRRLERWEAQRGNPAFHAYNLEELPVGLAFELVHVYVALRERFPNVYVDGIDFASPMGKYQPGKTALAQAWQYVNAFPELRVMAFAQDVGDIDSLALLARATHNTAGSREARGKHWVRDVRCSGHIELSTVLSDPSEWQKLQEFWYKREERLDRLGKPSRFVPMAVSRRTQYFMHEFGHLVECEMVVAAGFDALEPAFRAVSKVVFGFTPKISQWRYHLGNFPSGYFAPGPHEGGAVRQRSTMLALRDQIGHTFGSYAATNRDELFAEVFSIAYGGTPKMRRDLGSFRTAVRASLKP